jgi:ERF superfamily
MSEAIQLPATVEKKERQDRPVVITDSGSMLEAIKQIALDPRIDIERMKQLIGIQKELLERQAEAEFNTAMSAAQADMGRVSVDAENCQTHSKYASYGQIDRHLRPVYSNHGFALSFDTETLQAPTETIRISCIVSHRGGFTRRYHVDMPADGKGAKGGDVMTKTHATGSAMSYGMRYLVKMIFNVAIGEDDDDGTEGRRVTEEQYQALVKLITDLGGNQEKLLKYFKLRDFHDCLAANYDKVVSEIQALAKQRKARSAGQPQ